jgi:hypothetical protein
METVTNDTVQATALPELPTLPTKSEIELTLLEKLELELSASLATYHEVSETLTLAQINTYNAKHTKLRELICDAYSDGAKQWAGYQKPRGMKKNPTTVEVYAFADADGHQYAYAQGVTIAEAVANWNRGKVTVKVV